MKTWREDSRFTRGWPVSARIGYYTGPRETSGCRLWTGSTTHGYAKVSIGGKMLLASRVILGLPVGGPRVAMHSCDNPSCVEPSHLRIGTFSDNSRDMMAKRRGVGQYSSKMTCLRGHIPGIKNGRKRCLKCENLMRRKKWLGMRGAP